jgi:hypothetical protein
VLYIDQYRAAAGEVFAPVGFAAAMQSFTNTTDVTVGATWLPGDYFVVAAWNQIGGTLTVPSWLTRLDGGAATDNPALMGGFITDGLELFLGGTALQLTVASSAAATGMHLAAGIYRNVNAAGPSDFVHEVLDDSPLNDTLGPIDVLTDGFGLAFAEAATNNALHFLFDTPATDRLSVETSATNNRADRLFDVGGPQTAFSFQTTTSTGLSVANHAWASALDPGPLSYDPQNTISLVGVGAGVGTLTGTTVTVPLPGSLAAGDLIIIALHQDFNAGDPWTTPSGYSKLRGGGGADNITLFVKRATGSDSDPTITSAQSGSRKQGISAAYRNVAGVTWYQTDATTGSLTPTRNTTVDNTVAVALCASEFYQPITLGTANGYTQQTVRNDTSDGAISLSDKTVASPGAPSFPVHSAPDTSFMSSALLFLVPD